MGLESVTYISDLVVTWPLGTDKIRQGDDHLRNIKRAIRNTFPNINAPVTASPAALNSLPLDFQAVLTELLEHVVQPGMISMWSGNIGSIPAGWALCNGQTVAGFGVTPDLRDRFIIGAGGAFAVATTGGAFAGVTGTNGGHTGVIQGTVLTEAQLASHSHRLWAWAGNQSGDVQDSFQQGTNDTVIAGESTPSARAYLGQNGAGVQLVENAGNSEAHTHVMDPVPGHNHSVDTTPPYYALAFIIKTTAFVAP